MTWGGREEVLSLQLRRDSYSWKEASGGQVRGCGGLGRMGQEDEGVTVLKNKAERGLDLVSGMR